MQLVAMAMERRANIGVQSERKERKCCLSLRCSAAALSLFLFYFYFFGIWLGRVALHRHVPLCLSCGTGDETKQTDNNTTKGKKKGESKRRNLTFT